MKVTRTEIAPLVFLTCITTDKFKTGCLSISLLTQLQRDTAAMNALTLALLRRENPTLADRIRQGGWTM